MTFKAAHNALGKFKITPLSGPTPYAMGDLCGRIDVVHLQSIRASAIHARTMLLNPFDAAPFISLVLVASLYVLILIWHGGRIKFYPTACQQDLAGKDRFERSALIAEARWFSRPVQ